MVGWFRGNLKFNRMIYFQKCLHNSEKAYKCARYLTFWHPDKTPYAVRRDLDLKMWLRQESNADEKRAPLSASRQHAEGCSSGPGFDNVAPPGIEPGYQAPETYVISIILRSHIGSGAKVIISS
jgi:hypothetical protein